MFLKKLFILLAISLDPLKFFSLNDSFFSLISFSKIYVGFKVFLSICHLEASSFTSLISKVRNILDGIIPFFINSLT